MHMCVPQTQPLQSWVGVGGHRNECWISESCCHGTKTRICLHYPVWLDLSESSFSLSHTHTYLTDVHSCRIHVEYVFLFLYFLISLIVALNIWQFRTQFVYPRLTFQCTLSARQMQTCKPLHAHIHRYTKSQAHTQSIKDHSWLTQPGSVGLIHKAVRFWCIPQQRGLPSHPLIHQPILMHIHSS